MADLNDDDMGYSEEGDVFDWLLDWGRQWGGDAQVAQINAIVDDEAEFEDFDD